MAKLKFHSDPAHGWLAVPVRMLMELNIAQHISGYSYLKGDTAYLEEDRDATLFVEAYKTAHGEAPAITDMPQSNKRSRIRSYPSYSASALVQAWPE